MASLDENETLYSKYRPVAGVKADLDSYFNEFKQTTSVRYEDFNKIWKRMKLHLIFSGRQNSRECREFAETLFGMVLNHLLTVEDKLQISVGVIYLLYGLYFTQPIDPPSKIRLTLEHWSELLKVIGEVRAEQHYDVEYVFNMLKAYRAFQFVATKLWIYPEQSTFLITDEDDNSAEIQALQDQQSILSDILEPSSVEQLSEIHEQYHKMKCTLSGPDESQPSTSLNMLHPDLVQYIYRTIGNHEIKRKAIIGHKGRRRRDSRDHSAATTTSESEADSDLDLMSSSPTRASPKLDVGSRRAEIKARAFTGTPTTRAAKLQWKSTNSSPDKHSPRRKSLSGRRSTSPKSPRHEPSTSGIRANLLKQETTSPRQTRKSKTAVSVDLLCDSVEEIDDEDADVDFIVTKARKMGVPVVLTGNQTTMVTRRKCKQAASKPASAQDAIILEDNVKIEAAGNSQVSSGKGKRTRAKSGQVLTELKE